MQRRVCKPETHTRTVASRRSVNGQGRRHGRRSRRHYRGRRAPRTRGGSNSAAAVTAARVVLENQAQGNQTSGRSHEKNQDEPTAPRERIPGATSLWVWHFLNNGRRCEAMRIRGRFRIRFWGAKVIDRPGSYGHGFLVRGGTIILEIRRECCTRHGRGV